MDEMKKIKLAKWTLEMEENLGRSTSEAMAELGNSRNQPKLKHRSN